MRFRTPKPLIVGLSSLRRGAAATVTAVATRTGELTETLGAPWTWADGFVGCSTTPVLMNSFFRYERVACPATLSAPTGDCGTRTFSIRRGTGFYLGYGDGYPDDLTIQLAVKEPVFRACPAWGTRRAASSSAPPCPSARCSRAARSWPAARRTCSSTTCALPTEPGLTGQTLVRWTVRFERL